MVAEQTVFAVCGKSLFLLQLFLQAGQLAVFQLSGTVKIVFVFCAGNIRVNLFNAFTVAESSSLILNVNPTFARLPGFTRHSQCFSSILRSSKNSIFPPVSGRVP